MHDTLKEIALAAALVASGGAAALAQGSPPGGAWTSTWPAYAEAQCAQAKKAHATMTTPRPERRAAARRNSGPVPVASNAPGQRRGS